VNIIIIYTSPWWNAAANYAVTTASGLRTRGHRVVFVSDGDSPAAARARGQDLPVVHVPLRSMKPWSVRKSMRILKEMVADLQVDVINAHSPQGHILAALGRLPVPVVRTRCDDRPVQRNPVNRWLYGRHAGAVVLPSEAGRERLVANIKLPRELLRVIHYGLDVEGFAGEPVEPALRKMLDIPSDRVIIGNLGRLSPEKGPFHFLDVIATAARECPEIHAVMTGLAVQYTPADLLAAGKDRGLEGRLSVLPPFEDPRQAIHEFDIAVIASQYSENICRVALEYMALQKPVVSTSVNVLAELFETNVGGCIFQKDDVAGMSAAVVQLVRDPEFRRRIGRAGYERAKALYDLSGFIDRTESVLRTVAEGASA